MAWYPGAVRMELQPESDQQPSIRPTQFIVHSIIAPWTARRTYEFWRDSTNLESHYGLGYAGDLAQYIGTETRADANYLANRRADGTGAVSCETASNTSGTDPWTAEQIEELIKLGVWLHRTHSIPLRICRTHDDPGFGYHRLHPEWAKDGTNCPGDARVKQFKEIVFPGIVARATGQTINPPSEEDEMPETPVESKATVTALRPNEWMTIAMANDSAIVAGPCYIDELVQLKLTGATHGSTFQARFYVVNPTTGERSSSLTVTRPVLVDADGEAFVDFPMKRVVPANMHLKVEVRSSAAATIVHRVSSPEIWR